MAVPRTTIARMRWHRGLTQNQLALLSGLSIKTIEKVEAGTSKGSPKTALLLAGALAVDVQDVVDALLKDYKGGMNNTGSGTVVQMPGADDGEQERGLNCAAEA